MVEVLDIQNQQVNILVQELAQRQVVGHIHTHLQQIQVEAVRHTIQGQHITH
jgi:hypothetical protein